MKTKRIKWTLVPKDGFSSQFTAWVGGTRYWVTWKQEFGCWIVEDNFGAVWGDFKTARQACRAVASM